MYIATVLTSQGLQNLFERTYNPLTEKGEAAKDAANALTTRLIPFTASDKSTWTTTSDLEVRALHKVSCTKTRGNSSPKVPSQSIASIVVAVRVGNKQAFDESRSAIERLGR
jgi:hypothetical protein